LPAWAGSSRGRSAEVAPFADRRLVWYKGSTPVGIDWSTLVKVWVRQQMAYMHPDHSPMPFPVPGWMWDRERGQRLYADRLAFVQRMDALGLDGLVFTEHHFGPNGGLTPSPLIMLSAAAGVTRHVNLVTLGVVLSLYGHPVRVAEELAMVDNISGGRLAVGLISAGAQNLYAYGMAPEHERARYHEAFDLMVRAWTDDKPFAWHGEHYHYECVSILPRPLQDPHPPIWTVAASTESLQWAARNHIGIIASGNIDDSLRLIEYYRRFAETECGWAPGPESVGIAREICIASSEGAAKRLAERVLNGDRSDIVENIAASPQLVETGRAVRATKTYVYRPAATTSMMRGGRSEEGIAGGQFLVGTPASITERVLAQQAACNAGVLVLRAEMSDLPLDEVGDEFEIIARDVLPTLHQV